MNYAISINRLMQTVAQMSGNVQLMPVIPFGIAAIDECLPSTGIRQGALHEFTGSPQLADDAAATCFIAGVVARIEGTVIWCLHWQDLFAPSLYLSGLHPDRVIFAECGNDKGVLAAMEEALRHPGLAAVVGEIRKFSTTASKRLQLAAEKSGVAAFVFRRWAKTDGIAGGTASITRWRITAAPSEALGIASIGRPRWHINLERARGGEPKSWIVEACDAKGRIALPAELADRPALAEERQVAA